MVTLFRVRMSFECLLPFPLSFQLSVSFQRVARVVDCLAAVSLRRRRLLLVVTLVRVRA